MASNCSWMSLPRTMCRFRTQPILRSSPLATSWRTGGLRRCSVTNWYSDNFATPSRASSRISFWHPSKSRHRNHLRAVSGPVHVVTCGAWFPRHCARNCDQHRRSSRWICAGSHCAPALRAGCSCDSRLMLGTAKVNVSLIPRMRELPCWSGRGRLGSAHDGFEKFRRDCRRSFCDTVPMTS